MIFTLLLKPGFKNILKILALVILITFSTTLYSCQTTEIYNYSPEQLKTDDDISILEITTKNDSTIKLGNYDVMYMENYIDSSDILLIEKTNIPHSSFTYKPTLKPKKNLQEINLKDIKNIKVKKLEFDLGNTLIFSGVTLVALVVTGIIISKNISINIH